MNYPIDPDAMKKYREKLALAQTLIQELGIRSYNGHDVHINDLYDLLNDEQKLKNLVSKLKMKAFW